MTFLPIVTPWLFWPLALVVLGAAVALLFFDGSGWRPPRHAGTARWRYAAIVLLVVLAGARPGLAGAPAPVASSELNVFFVVDVTPSSAAEDFNGAEPRIDGMKEDIVALAGELAGARFSLISFDSSAKVVLPLTTDATALRTLTQVLTPRSAYASQGSSIGAARDVLLQRLGAAQQSHPNRPRLVFYLGDGEQTSATAPESFAKAAALTDGGAVLGYGTEAGGKMREHLFGSDTAGSYIVDKSNNFNPAVSSIDEKALSSLAGQLDVPYVHRTDNAGIDAALGKSAPRVSAAPAGVHALDGAGRWEAYWLFALAAFGLVLWHLAELVRSWRQMPAQRKDPKA